MSLVPLRFAAFLLLTSKVGDAESSLDPATSTVNGSVTSGNFCGYIGSADKTYEDRRFYYTLHFTAHFDVKPIAHGGWHDTTLYPGGTTAKGGTGLGSKGFPEAGHGSGIYLTFAPGCPCPHRHLLRFGTQCRREPTGRSTGSLTANDMASRARANWNRRLSQITVDGGTSEQRVVFRTALYHSLHHI
ncbi:glycoside hydrolase domain-containing protein [Granulicella sp. S190]|uniref:glycoside hydrolase domain-containing protein n=1 Tax=Granulicella sp. S190 TaxID=1747226 RepID=UPI00352B080E